MYLVERFWSAVTAVVSIVTLDPFGHNVHNQTPLQNSLLDKILPVDTNYGASDSGPIFQPPGTIGSSDFVCDYSAMVGWEPCSTSSDRTCWLQKIDGSEAPFTVFTDYESRAPIGIPRYYTLDVSDSFWDADGMNFTEAKLFNNAYPGPWIEACWGDTIIVNVTNSLIWNGTSVHWHGIRQNITMQSDGVNGVTQCPIAPSDYFVYQFKAIQYGSSWYHSHYSVQYADGAAGPLTLHGPASAPYDEAISPPLIMTDWSHDSAFYAVIAGKLKDGDILLNGRGDISKFSSHKNTTEILPAYNITFDELQPRGPVKKYLLRIINTSFQTTFLFTIDHHEFSVVETDFVPVFPYKTNSILVGIGQRYDIIVDALPQAYKHGSLPEDGNYWIRTLVVDNCAGDMHHPWLAKHPDYAETGILRYNASSTKDPKTKRWPDIPKAPKCQDQSSGSFDRHMHPVVPWTVGPPANALPNGQKQGFNLTFKQDHKVYPLATWHLGPTVGGVLAAPLRIDYSNPTFLNLNSSNWLDTMRITPEPFNYTDGETHWVYLVISSTSGSHPIHLHGHDFAIVKAERGPYDPSKNLTLNLNNPPRRDVVLIPTDKHSVGYVIMAFKADNPGAWLVHCHIAFHISGGLGFQILEDQDNAEQLWPVGENNPPIVEAQRVCSGWENWAATTTHYFPQPSCTSGVEECFQNDSGV